MGVLNLGIFPCGQSKGFPPPFNSWAGCVWIHGGIDIVVMVDWAQEIRTATGASVINETT